MVLSCGCDNFIHNLKGDPTLLAFCTTSWTVGEKVVDAGI